MTSAMDDTRAQAGPIAVAVTPHGRILLCAPPAQDPGLAGDAASRIANAFAQGDGVGLFHLAASEVTTPLPPDFAFFRELGHLFMTGLCASFDLESPGGTLSIPVPFDRLAPLLGGAPPMIGGEYLTTEVLETAWHAMESASAAQRASFEGTAQDFLRTKDPVWNAVGRVHFHLAERKGNDTTPFAFLATYTTRLGQGARVQHVPLGRALTEYAGAGNRAALLALLGPVQRAAQHSRFLKALADSGEIYHTQAWAPAQAYAFLKEIPAFETAGIVVRVPDWWGARRPARPQVRVTAGHAPPGGLGLAALVDFSVDVVLGDQRLTQEELQSILASTEGLALVRGHWVEVDRERLAQALQHWKAIQKSAPDGITFLEAMRLLAGAPIGEDASCESPETSPDWSMRVAGDWMREAVEALGRPEAMEPPDPGAQIRAQLRPYQRVGLAWLVRLARLGLGGCLADDMGLGKTLQVLALLIVLRREKSGAAPRPVRGEPSAGRSGARHSSRCALLVVPASLIANWVDEIARFAPSLRVLVAHPSVLTTADLASLGPESLTDKDLVITSYGYLDRLAWAADLDWRVVIADEAQAIKNPGARQTRRLKSMRASLHLALTGTPVENRLMDLWSIFDFLNPGLLGSAREFGRFAKELEERSEDRYGPLRRLIRPYILRRLKTDRSVIADLPEKTEVRAFCALTKVQAVLYQKAVDELAQRIETLEGMQRRGVVLAMLSRLKQICNHPSQWLRDGGFAPAQSGKFERLEEIARELASRQEKVLVFTQYREMTDPLAQFLAGLFGKPGVVLHGETPVKKRRELIQRFQDDETVPFFVLSLKAGGTGLNLTAAAHVIHFDRWWNPAVEDQATDRAFRIGQKQNVMVHKFVCRGTVEERIDALLGEKQRMSRELLAGGAEAVLTELSNRELLALVRLDLKSTLADN